MTDRRQRQGEDTEADDMAQFQTLLVEYGQAVREMCGPIVPGAADRCVAARALVVAEHRRILQAARRRA